MNKTDVQKIHLPIPISRELRARIDRRYAELCEEEIDRSTINNLTRHLPRLLKRLLAGEGRFRHDLARTAKALFDAYVRFSATGCAKVRLSEAGRCSVIGALRYLCDPNDVVPDYLGIEGFIDDAHVLNECVVALKKSDRAVYDDIIAALQKKT